MVSTKNGGHHCGYSRLGQAVGAGRTLTTILCRTATNGRSGDKPGTEPEQSGTLAIQEGRPFRPPQTHQASSNDQSLAPDNKKQENRRIQIMDAPFHAKTLLIWMRRSPINKESAMRTITLLLAALTMAGCATNTPEESRVAPLAIPSESRTQLIVNFKAGNQVFRNAYWDQLKSSWRTAIQSEASTHGYTVSEQVGPIATSPNPGLLLIIKVDDFRYITEPDGDDAWVDARVIYLDAQTAKEYGERSYNTASPSLEEISSAVTNVQIRALAKRMISEIQPPKESAPATPPPTSISEQVAASSEQGKQQQLERLNREGLSYEEYQRRYREIMGR